MYVAAAGWWGVWGWAVILSGAEALVITEGGKIEVDWKEMGIGFLGFLDSRCARQARNGSC